jgi:hypothetical protein
MVLHTKISDPVDPFLWEIRTNVILALYTPTRYCMYKMAIESNARIGNARKKEPWQFDLIY